jgi:hypothetical protein
MPAGAPRESVMCRQNQKPLGLAGLYTAARGSGGIKPAARDLSAYASKMHGPEIPGHMIISAPFG